MQKVFSLLISLKVSIFCFSQTDSAVYSSVQTKYYFDWGNNKTEITLRQYGQRKDLVMIHLHDNEFASAEAAEKMLGQAGGLLIVIDNKGRRLINFKKSGKIFHFDPNRIFTPQGLRTNLHFLNEQVTSAAVSSVKAFAAFILQKIPNSATTLISLHNNKDGEYSIKTYRTKSSYAKDVLKIYSNKKNDPDNFFIVTSSKIFAELKKARYNVVLQNRKISKDDGSLSVYYGRRKKTVYVNVEAQQGSLKEQLRMLESLSGFLQK
jgi:hypothetical protein